MSFRIFVIGLTALWLLVGGLIACGDEPPPATQSSTNPDLSATLRRHVTQLATNIGARNTRHPESYRRAADYITGELQALGLPASRHTFTADAVECANLVAQIDGRGKRDEIVIFGAHYDSVWDCPGANDNASGVAVTLEMARLLRKELPSRTLRFVFFANEEPPHFVRPTMGSLVYARECFEKKENVVAMLSIETVGYYSEEKGSQKYPPALAERYPDVGNFVAFVGSLEQKEFVDACVARFKVATDFPVQSAALPPVLPGVSWSDHWSFWQFRYKALMVTDTAPFRYPHYHTRDDTPDKVDYASMAKLTTAMAAVVRSLAEE